MTGTQAAFIMAKMMYVRQVMFCSADGVNLTTAKLQICVVKVGNGRVSRGAFTVVTGSRACGHSPSCWP